MGRLNPRLAIAAAAVLVLVAAAAGYAYFFSGLRAAPRPLALTSPSASAAPVAASELAGDWQVAAGSSARFRVRETVGGVGAHEAVSETSQVTGGLTLAAAAAGYQASALRVTVGLAGLRSVDTLAGRDVTQRDGTVQRALSTNRFPNAVFEADSVSVPAELAGGGPVTVTIPGRLNLHGVTRPIQATAQVQVTGVSAQAVGGFDVDMTDFGIQPPSAPGITPSSATHLEFQVNLKRG